MSAFGHVDSQVNGQYAYCLDVPFNFFCLKDQLKAVQELERNVASHKPQMDELELVHQVSYLLNRQEFRVSYPTNKQASMLLRYWFLCFLLDPSFFLLQIVWFTCKCQQQIYFIVILNESCMMEVKATRSSDC